MATQRKNGGNVRIGIVSFITLVSVLLLAVLTVLCVVTANATSATASREATSVTSLYEVDACGQALLSQVDAQLAKSKAAGENANAAADHVRTSLNTITARALELADASDGSVTLDASVSGATLSFTATAGSGRTLEAKVRVNDDLTYTISSWKTTTAQSQQPADNLWGGAAGETSGVSAAATGTGN